MKRVVIPTTEQPPRYVVNAHGELPPLPEDDGRTDGDRASFTLGRLITGHYFKVSFFREGHYHMHPIPADTPLLGGHHLTDQLPES